MSIKLKLDGFDELIKKIEKANGNVDEIVTDCMKKSADIMEAELKSQMQDANVSKKLIDKMPPPVIENDYGEITARVGYKKGAYDPNNPSVGYKVVFMNYGTPYRTKHGKIKDISEGGKKLKLGFIARAHAKAKPKIKKQQKNALEESLKGLQ